MTNRPEWVMFYYGIARIGAIPVCISGAYKRLEATEIIKNSRSSILVTSEDHLDQLPHSEAIPLIDTVIQVESDETFQATWDLSLAFGKTPAEANDFPGFIANRILMPMITSSGRAQTSATRLRMWLNSGMSSPGPRSGTVLGCHPQRPTVRCRSSIGNSHSYLTTHDFIPSGTGLL